MEDYKEDTWYQQGQLLFTVKQDGWRKGKPVMINHLTVRVQAANQTPEADADALATELHQHLTRRNDTTSNEQLERLLTLAAAAGEYEYIASDPFGPIDRYVKACNPATLTPLLLELQRHRAAAGAGEAAEAVREACPKPCPHCTGWNDCKHNPEVQAQTTSLNASPSTTERLHAAMTAYKAAAAAMNAEPNRTTMGRMHQLSSAVIEAEDELDAAIDAALTTPATPAAAGAGEAGEAGKLPNLLDVAALREVLADFIDEVGYATNETTYQFLAQLGVAGLSILPNTQVVALQRAALTTPATPAPARCASTCRAASEAWVSVAERLPEFLPDKVTYGSAPDEDDYDEEDALNERRSDAILVYGEMFSNSKEKAVAIAYYKGPKQWETVEDGWSLWEVTHWQPLPQAPPPPPARTPSGTSSPGGGCVFAGTPTTTASTPNALNS